ncbi:hypothetical protein GFER_16135 [Geoalkalibacter ferrihydriticus DSM 17813]|uniref:Uncharacterized protein n=1 Tax=Geoalkalibacter ferrihydriticus DSM 17813 TaxID=1121915 RepID=A0A0C2EA67_9BACT|nr:hypothetical protein GFER_16135 [Geoalkalibacter ferrihydriticus DSM 17813]
MIGPDHLKLFDKRHALAAQFVADGKGANRQRHPFELARNDKAFYAAGGSVGTARAMHDQVGHIGKGLRQNRTAELLNPPDEGIKLFCAARNLNLE